MITPTADVMAFIVDPGPSRVIGDTTHWTTITSGTTALTTGSAAELSDDQIAEIAEIDLPVTVTTDGTIVTFEIDDSPYYDHILEETETVGLTATRTMTHRPPDGPVATDVPADGPDASCLED